MLPKVKRMIQIGIQANTGKPNALALAKQIYAVLAELGAVPVYEHSTARALGAYYDGSAFEKITILLAVGGDGTILRSAVSAAMKDVSVLGVNLGKLGFLSEIEPHEIYAAGKRLIAGDYTIERRSMLEGTAGQTSFYALNDIVVFKKDFSHMLRMNIRVDGHDAGEYAGDGIIISTPTGSTAYSLSAGGPVVAPNVEGILVTPINPHSLGVRPFIVSQSSRIEIFVEEGECPACISADGTHIAEQGVCGKLQIKNAEKAVRLIHLKDFNFFNLIRQKLY